VSFNVHIYRKPVCFEEHLSRQQPTTEILFLSVVNTFMCYKCFVV